MSVAGSLDTNVLVRLIVRDDEAQAVVVAKLLDRHVRRSEHGVNGLLFDFFDVAALSKQVIDVLDDPESYRHLGIGARQSVLDRYDLQTKCLPAQINLIAGPASTSTSATGAYSISTLEPSSYDITASRAPAPTGG